MKLVATLADLTAETLPAARAEALRVADLVEFRLDRLPPLPLARLLGEAAARAIVTFRPVREGGLFSGDEATREQRLRDALALGAAFVDVEWDADFADAVIAALSRAGRALASRLRGHARRPRRPGARHGGAASQPSSSSR